MRECVVLHTHSLSRTLWGDKLITHMYTSDVSIPTVTSLSSLVQCDSIVTTRVHEYSSE